MTTLVEVYRHVGERVRVDVSKKDISSAKYNVVVVFVGFATGCQLSCLPLVHAFSTNH